MSTFAPCARGKLRESVATRCLPRFRHKQSQAYCYAIPFKRLTYWLLLEPNTWTLASTNGFRRQYRPANTQARQSLAAQLRLCRRYAYNAHAS